MIQHLAQLKEQAVENLSKKTKLFNPCKNDFKMNMFGREVLIPAREIKEFPFNEARLIEKHLADQLVGERDLVYPNREEIYKEIEVNL